MHAKKPRRSPLLLRFLTYLLEEISYAICITYFPTIPYARDTGCFYLPERALTDEELLQILDFNSKRDFALEQNPNVQ
jgi:hypothetical protein